MSRFSNDIEEIWVLCESGAGVGNGTIEFVLGSVECDGKLHDHGTHVERSRFSGGGSFVNANSYYDVFLLPKEGEEPDLGGSRNDRFLITTRPKDIRSYLAKLEGMVGRRVRATVKWRPDDSLKPVELKSRIEAIGTAAGTSAASPETEAGTRVPGPPSEMMLPGVGPVVDRVEAEIAGLNQDGTRRRKR